MTSHDIEVNGEVIPSQTQQLVFLDMYRKKRLSGQCTDIYPMISGVQYMEACDCCEDEESGFWVEFRYENAEVEVEFFPMEPEELLKQAKEGKGT